MAWVVSFTLRNSILANTIGGSDCSRSDGATILENINNLIEENDLDLQSCGTPTVVSDPLLGLLADNGGPTQTMALLAGSPAIDMADDAACEATDQRGISRPQGAHCDIGAYEYQDTTLPVVNSIALKDSNPTGAATVTFTVTFSEAVTGVNGSDFSLTTTGSISGAGVTGVADVGDQTSYTVTVATGAGNGTIRLDVKGSGTGIKDLAGNALSGGFTSGQMYTINKDAQVEVYIAEHPEGSYQISPGESRRETYDNLDNGPVKVVSTNGVPIIASMRINLKTLPSYASYSEFMGIPASKLTDTYLFPWYNNATTGGLSSQLRFGNVGSDPTLVTVTIGGVERGSYPLDPNESARVTFDNVDAGPVEVTSSGGVPIIASMRINLKTLPSYSSYSEFMGLSASATPGTSYLFPWYNNATTGGLSSQLRFGNVGSDPTLVTVTIGGVERGSYPLDPNESARVTFDNVDAGPVEVTSSGGVPIIASMRINLKTLPSYASYSEFMGLPGAMLTETRYLFPWYNNATTGGLSSQLRFGNVGTDPTLVTVTIGGEVQDTYPLDPNESLRVTYDNVDAGPVEVTSSGGVPIIASMRINLKSLPAYSSYSEFMGLSVGSSVGMPGNELSSTYWFPWYNNATTGGLSSQLRFGVP